MQELPHRISVAGTVAPNHPYRNSHTYLCYGSCGIKSWMGDPSLQGTGAFTAAADFGTGSTGVTSSLLADFDQNPA